MTLRLEWLAVFLSCILLTCCDKQSSPVTSEKVAQKVAEKAAANVAPKWETHIVDYPKRWSPVEMPVIIRFSHPVIAPDKVNQPIEGVVEINAKIPVNVLFASETELRITPVGRFPNNATIKVTLHGDKLLNVEKSLKPFEFDLHTIKQDFDLKIHGLIAQTDAPQKMQFSGELRTNDTANLDDVKKVLRATINGQKVELDWKQNADRQSNEFVFNNIERKKEAGMLRIEWDGAGLESMVKGARDIEIPALTDFTVTGVEVVREPDLYVVVNFSGTVDPSQNLQGLVTIGNKDFSIKREGASLRIYPKDLPSGPQELVIASAVKSYERQALAKEYRQSLVLVIDKPSVAFVGNDTTVLPPAEHLTVPFTATNVDSVQVVAFKVFENNMGHFFQDYPQYNPGSAPMGSGRYLWRKVYRLPESAQNATKNYNLDLSELMAQHPDGLLRLELQIDRSNSTYPCAGERPKTPVRKMPLNRERNAGNTYYYGTEDDGDTYVMEDSGDEPQELPSWYRQYYQSQGYVNYNESNNPCSDSFFAESYYYERNNRTKSVRTFMVSNIGLLAKRGNDNKLHVIATSLNDAQPLASADIVVFNFQQQIIGKGITDAYGMLDIVTDGTPFYVQAQKDKQIGYLRVPKNEALPTNQFDVGGEHIKAGLKGFIYGERDVWRPGDDIYLTFIMQDKDERIPENYPVNLDFFDPQGKKISSQTNVTPVKDFYTFTLKTDEKAPTGNWRAVVHVGNRFFDKVIKVETVTPNRLKIELDMGSTLLSLKEVSEKQIQLFSQWLHGATAKNLKADVEVRLTPKKTSFSGYDDYVFDDPARVFEVTKVKAFEGNLNEEGKASFDLNLEANNTPPGMLSALFNTRVFEESGNFSTSLRSYDVSPYDFWVGMLLPKGDGYYNAYSREKDHEIFFQTLSEQGKLAAKRKLSVDIYALDWRWWWDQGEDNVAAYVGNTSHKPVTRADVVTDANGRANFKIEKDKYNYGRHLVRVCDTESNHCAGKMVYLGWSYNNERNPESATQLMLSTDKDKYQVGQTATVRLPAAAQGRVLLSIENGSHVIEKRWLDLQADQRDVTIPITAAMSPNAYVNMVLLLPHQARKSDAPMRLYGIVPLIVEDPATHLEPKLDVPEKVRPESTFAIKVSEKNGHAMTYSLAMVDEGLLGLTGFTAPDPHGIFYRREALGVSTWDMFDSVVGAYGASLERILSIGGSDAAQDAEKKRRERRFPPVVKFLGAFNLAAGETRSHEIHLPPYMGAVRVMLVAGDTEKIPAYGKAETTVQVTQPLVLYATLPRVLGPREEVMLPVNVFVSDPAIKQVKVAVEANDIFTLIDNKAELQFDKPGDTITRLRMKVNDRIGKGHVKISITGGNETATQEIYIDSRPANPPTVLVESKLLAPGEEWQVPIEAHGMPGTNAAFFEASVLPPLNLDKRLSYLISYPHGCVEQTTSSVFPQLYLSKLILLTSTQKAEVDKNIAAGITRLQGFQTSNGGLSYWPGESYVNDWGNNYAGHFLVEAKRAGYSVPSSFFDGWVKYQQERARANADSNDHGDEVAAYRLYTLALADKAELPAMNRLREKLLQLKPGEKFNARLLLASTYLHMGLKDASKDLIGVLPGAISPRNNYYSYTYGSLLVDESILLNAFVKSGEAGGETAWKLAEKISRSLSGNDWYSTHATAWSLAALGNFVGNRTGSKPELKFSLKQQPTDNWRNETIKQDFYKMDLQSPGVQVRNNDDKNNLHVLVSNRGIPALAEEQASANELSIDVKFFGMDNTPINVESLPQGTDFIAEVTVGAQYLLNSYKLEDVALTTIMPSGWQIRNERLEGVNLPEGIDYMDIRDDRVMSYFSLWRDYYWYYRYNDKNRASVKLRYTLNASYAGKFYLPSWQVAPMYDEKIFARTNGYWVEVVSK